MLKKVFFRKKHWYEAQQHTTERECLGIRSYSLLLAQVSLNEVRYLNEYLIRQNRLLIPGGSFICWFQTCADRKKEIFNKYPTGLRQIIYFFDVLWHRVCPKLPVLGKVYFSVTKGKNRVFPRPEILGRLYYCGFEVANEFRIGDNHYVAARKIGQPSRNPHPSYGLLTRLSRIGKDGERFNVYKLRSMHAYSEYLQTYIYKKNHLATGGKFANDYRIPQWGKFIRKYWIDELPMIFNLIKGDMKLIGVRPLSEQYFKLYSTELQELRVKTKPGLLPPYYADMPKTLEEIQASEIRYLKSYLTNPHKTDGKYFLMIICNILFKGIRSN